MFNKSYELQNYLDNKHVKKIKRMKDFEGRDNTSLGIPNCFREL